MVMERRTMVAEMLTEAGGVSHVGWSPFLWLLGMVLPFWMVLKFAGLVPGPRQFVRSQFGIWGNIPSDLQKLFVCLCGD